MTATGIFRCRRCDQTKPLGLFYPREAICIDCHNARDAEYKRSHLLNEKRERRVQMLAKQLARVMEFGECPVCGQSRHDQSCAVGRLDAELKNLGWIKGEAC